MIKIEDLSVAFDDTEAVKHVSLDLTDGEVLGVVGESGSGKSVTALTLMGLVSDSARITSGRVLFDDVVLREAGRPCDKMLYRQYQGARMSMVFHDFLESYPESGQAGGGNASSAYGAEGGGNEAEGAGSISIGWAERRGENLFLLSSSALGRYAPEGHDCNGRDSASKTDCSG